MNISEEIKRMMSLLESEMGNVKPLITEEGEVPVTPVNGGGGILMKAINTGCWTNKNYTFSDGTKITPFAKSNEDKISSVNDNYLYALNKIDPNIKVGAPFVKLKANGIDVYMFGSLSTNPQYPGEYLAITKNINAPQQTTANPNPNQNYLESHGWECPEFKATQNLTSQSVNMSQDQENAVKTLSTPEFIERIGGQIYTTKALGDQVNYQTIDLATGRDQDGTQLFNSQDMADLKKWFPTPGQFFVYKTAGNLTQRTNVPVEVEKFITRQGYTTQEPGPASAQAGTKTSVAEFCNTVMKGRCNDTMLEYVRTNGGQSIWEMNQAQREKFKSVDQRGMVAGFEANKRDLKRARKSSQNEFANRKYCNTGIEILTYCSKYNSNSKCEIFMDNLVAQGAITFPDNEAEFEDKIITLKKLLDDCAIGVDDGSVNIAKKYKAPFLQLRRSSGPFGMRAQVTPTPTQQGGRLPVTSESLNNSIKSVITETINKNNNKNLDSIIKKNLRKYIR